MLTAAVDTVLPTFRIYLRSDRPALIQADAQDKHERVEFRAAVQARNLPRSTVMSGELWRRPRDLLVVGEPRWPIPPFLAPRLRAPSFHTQGGGRFPRTCWSVDRRLNPTGRAAKHVRGHGHQKLKHAVARAARRGPDRARAAHGAEGRAPFAAAGGPARRALVPLGEPHPAHGDW